MTDETDPHIPASETAGTPAVYEVLNTHSQNRVMVVATRIDPAAAINAKARVGHWPFRCDSDLLFDRPELNLLRDLWRSHASKIGIPRHADFDAKPLESVLKHMTILERVRGTDGVSRFRIEHQGAYLAAVMGNNEGRYIDEGIPEALLPRWTTVFNSVLDGRAPVRVVADFEFAKLSYATGEAFVAPLSDIKGEAKLILVGVFIKPRECAENETGTNTPQD